MMQQSKDKRFSIWKIHTRSSDPWTILDGFSIVLSVVGLIFLRNTTLFLVSVEVYFVWAFWYRTLSAASNWRPSFPFFRHTSFLKKDLLLFWKGSFLCLCQGERERLGFRKHKFDDPARREQPQDIEVLNYTLLRWLERVSLFMSRRSFELVIAYWGCI